MSGPGEDAPSGDRLEISFEVREQLLSMAERMTRVGTFSADRDEAEVHWSENLYAILGYDPAATRPSAEAFYRRVHPSDVEWVQKVTRRAHETGSAEPIDFRVLHPNGTTHHIHMIAEIESAEGGSTRLVGALIDMTERVEAESGLRRREQAFQRAQEIAKVGTFEWDPVSGDARWSEQLHRMCGVPLDVKGTPELFFSMVHPDDRDRITGAAAAVTPGEPIGPWEYRVIRTDGEIVDVFGEASPVFDHHGNPTGYVGTALDISLRKRYEAQLLQSQKMEALGRLAGGVAHDFNNLLTIIGAHAGSLQRKLDEPSLTEIARAVERAGELTHQLLAFGRQAVLESREINPAVVVEESIRMMGRVLGEGVSLEFSTDASCGFIAVDPARLEQMLLNLVINARDAVAGSGSIRVSLENESLEASLVDSQPMLWPGEYVALTVEDDGTGMTEEVAERAFEPFFTSKQPGQGTGLGLAMVYGIVSQYGGGLVLDTRPGEGTRIRAYFPRVREPSVPSPPVAVPAAPERAARVLLVDDERSVREIFGAVLRDAGYDVALAESGEAALALLNESSEPFDTLVTDVVMPGMGGIALVRAVREREATIPVMYLSGFARAAGEIERDPLVHGAFLQKPCTAEELVARVGELVGRSSTARG